jgi:hypothetical protein
MGYGQGFVTQSALLLDRMKDGEKMLEWMSKAIYDPKYQPFIAPEGCEISDDGRFWHRTGDLGNGVQEAEIVKTLRIVIGIDNPQPGKLRIIPRMPYGWKRIEVKNYPIWLGKGERANIEYKLTRDGKGMRMEIRADKNLPKMKIRLGPFSQKPKEWKGELEFSGDSWWIWYEFPAGLRAIEVWGR